MPLPEIGETYEDVRRDMLNQIREEPLPVQIYIPPAYAGTKIHAGEADYLDPKKPPALSPKICKDLEVLEGIKLSLNFFGQMDANDRISKLTDETINNYISKCKEKGIYPELDNKEKWRAIDPLRIAAIENVIKIYDEGVENFRKGGEANFYQYTPQTVTFLKAHGFDSARAEFMMKNVPDMGSFSAEQLMVLAMSNNMQTDPLRRNALLSKQDQDLDKPKEKAGIKVHTVITPINIARSARSYFRYKTAVDDPLMDGVLPLTMQERARGVLYHELAHALTYAWKQHHQKFILGVRGTLMDECISDVFEYISLGQNRTLDKFRGLHVLTRDAASHYTTPATYAITPRDYTAKSLSFKERHKIATDIAYRFPPTEEEVRLLEETGDAVREVIAKFDRMDPKSPNSKFDVIAGLTENQLKDPNLYPVHKLLLKQVMKETDFIEQCQDGSSLPYYEDILSTMRFTGSLVGAVETLNFEYKDLIYQEKDFQSDYAIAFLYENKALEELLKKTGFPYKDLKKKECEPTSKVEKNFDAIADAFEAKAERLAAIGAALKTSILREKARFEKFHPAAEQPSNCTGLT